MKSGEVSESSRILRMYAILSNQAADKTTFVESLLVH